MEKFKKPLTWVLGIVFVGYLFIANCECGEENTCPLNNGFNISNAGINNGFNISNADLNNRFNISNAGLNNGFNISNAGLNGEMLKADSPETVEENEDPLEFTEDLEEAKDEEIKEDINPSSTLEGVLQNLLEKKE